MKLSLMSLEVVRTETESDFKGKNKLEIENPKSKLRRRVELTFRDHQILEYILDMKFSSPEEIYFKFSKTPELNVTSESFGWAKRRLRYLNQAGFLISHSTLSNNGIHYTVSFKAYYALMNSYPEKVFSKPIPGFDHRTFFHDKFVSQIRLKYQSEGKCSSWISERQLKSGLAMKLGLTNVYIPDGIYVSPTGTRVALELEIVQKSQKRYQDKIRKYVSLMRERKSDPMMFQRVHFICLREASYNAIMREIKIYGDLFQIEFIDCAKLRGEG